MPALCQMGRGVAWGLANPVRTMRARRNRGVTGLDETVTIVGHGELAGGAEGGDDNTTLGGGSCHGDDIEVCLLAGSEGAHGIPLKGWPWTRRRRRWNHNHQGRGGPDHAQPERRLVRQSLLVHCRGREQIGRGSPCPSRLGDADEPGPGSGDIRVQERQLYQHRLLRRCRRSFRRSGDRQLPGLGRAMNGGTNPGRR